MSKELFTKDELKEIARAWAIHLIEGGDERFDEWFDGEDRYRNTCGPVNPDQLSGLIGKKLYKVNLRGMTYSTHGAPYGISYVIADNPHEAYLIVRRFLDENGIGTSHERELKSVELIAEAYRYTGAEFLLHPCD